MPVGKSDSLAELKSESTAIGRNLPRFRQRWLSLLRGSINLDQIAHKTPDYLARNRVRRCNWIERLWFGPLSDGQVAAVVAGDLRQARKFFAGFGCIGNWRCGKACTSE
jgi:hypothetical protein